MGERPLVDPVVALQTFIDERWSVAQPKFYRDGPARLTVPPELTAAEARWFLAAARSWLEIDDDRKLRSDRFPPKERGEPRGYNFFESCGDGTERGRLRDEWIVQIAAAETLRDEFGWPLTHLVLESPIVLGPDGAEILHQDALDVLLLDDGCAQLARKMPKAALRSSVIAEAKFHAVEQAAMIRKMRNCDGTDHNEHAKCRGLQTFEPNFFLAVAASETWRLFKVIEGPDGRRILGDEIPSDEQGPHLQFGG